MEEIRWTDCVRNEEVLRVKEKKIFLLTIKWTKSKWIFFTSCVETTVWNTLLKDRHKGREGEEEDVSSYWMTLRKAEYTGNWKWKHYTAFFVWLASKKVMVMMQIYAIFNNNLASWECVATSGRMISECWTGRMWKRISWPALVLVLVSKPISLHFIRFAIRDDFYFIMISRKTLLMRVFYTCLSTTRCFQFFFFS
jgi:hypothetical protein